MSARFLIKISVSFSKCDSSGVIGVLSWVMSEERGATHMGQSYPYLLSVYTTVVICLPQCL